VRHLFLAATLLAHSTALFGSFFQLKEGHEFSIGPEVFYTDRELQTGTTMDGWFQGWRGTYEHLHPYSLYFGAESSFSQGFLKGERSNGASQQGDFLELDTDLRIGYTLGIEKWKNLTFTPFVGYKYYCGHLILILPSTPAPTCEDHFSAFTMGLITKFDPCQRVRIGFDLRSYYMFSGENTLKRVSSSFPLITRTMGEDFHWTLQVPIDIQICSKQEKARLRFMPFLRHKSYGAWGGSPANFPKTTLCSYGVAVMLLYKV
jgi:hypothetical protein